MRLRNWSERKAKGDDIGSVMNEIYRRTDGINASNAKEMIKCFIALFMLIFNIYILANYLTLITTLRYAKSGVV